MLSSEKPVLRARRSCPGLCTQAHFPSRFPASEDGQLEASRTGGESAGHLGAGGAPEGPASGHTMALWFRRLGALPDASSEDLGPWQDGAPGDRAASREGLDPERAEVLSRTLSQARATGTPLPSLLHPGCGTEASSRSAAPGG
ncbi:hypothetical protein CapIbe_013628 [Capra ibex]